MKAMLTVAIVLGLLVTFASADSPAEELSKDLIVEQHEKNIEICTQNLVAIGKAVEVYKKEHGDFPKWLSELYPKYLPDANLLLCPADEGGGKPIFTHNADPEMPVSYGYQFHPEYRVRKSEERTVYGDVIPLARCRHHTNQEFECLNLSFSLKVYRSLGTYTLEEMYGSHEAAITAFENALALYPEDRRFFDLYPQLVRLYIKVGNEQSADTLIERLKSGMIPDDKGYRSVLRILGEAKLYEELLEIYKAAEQQYQQHPDERRILGRLAYIYEKLGNVELAEVYHRKSEDLTEAQSQKNIEICKQHFREIGKAIQAYKKEHGDFPKWLSELHPKYLPDANLLLCPADKEGGKPISYWNADPNMPVSYGYEFLPKNREKKTEQRKVYGDVIPLVRCLHHMNWDEVSKEGLNLSFSLKIYKSGSSWISTPEDMYGSHEAAIAAFENSLAQYPEDRRFFDLYPILVVLYTKVGNEKSADALIERFKSGMIPDNKGYRSVHGKLRNAGLYEELLEIFKAAEQRQPDDEVILVRLAYIYEKLGNTELAEVYYRKTDPKYELWGKLVTDFSATDLDGNPISLQQYRGKVVLLDFWGVWCGFCIDEMPNLKRLHDTYKDQGFDIIGVSLDDKEPALRDYIKENDIQWRQIYSGKRWEEDPLAQQFKITGVPSQWLIDRDGKLITHKARAEKLEQLVVEALKDKSANR